MSDPMQELRNQVDALQRQLLRIRRLMGILAGLVGVATVGIWMACAREPAILRARGLVIEDERGRDRVVLGAPVPDPTAGKRMSPSVGLVINDEQGNERFGVGLDANSRMGMGFDAPPGTGDPRNPERINIVADETGGAYIRFLDRRTAVVGRLVLGADDRFWLEFLDFPAGEVVRRRIGFGGEETLRESR
jgi:hypothetical protein